MSNTPQKHAACPLCSEPALLLRKSYRGFREPDHYDLFECDKCDLQFAWPFQANNDIYQAIYKNPSRFSGYDRYESYKRESGVSTRALDLLKSKEAMYWFIANEISLRDHDRSKRILEVGCGLGYLTHALNQAGHNTLGVDISEPAIAQAKAQFGDKYLHADVSTLGATMSETFDLIVMTEVLEHLESPKSIMSSLWELLAPGGCALITTPSKNFLPPGAVWRTDSPPVHLAWYSETSLREIARRTGFRISFADFTAFNAANVAGVGKRRDLTNSSGAHRLSAQGEPLDRIKQQTATNAFIDSYLPSLRRQLRRKKFTERAAELYASQSEVIGAVFQRPVASERRSSNHENMEALNGER